MGRRMPKCGTLALLACVLLLSLCTTAASGALVPASREGWQARGAGQHARHPLQAPAASDSSGDSTDGGDSSAQARLPVTAAGVSPKAPPAPPQYRAQRQRGAPARPTAAAAAQLPPLIPLKLLMGPSRIRQPQLSPDGTLIAFISPAPDSGLNSVFVAALPPPSRGGSAPTAAPASSRSSSSRSSSSSSSSSSSTWLPAQQAPAAPLRLQPVQVTATRPRGVSNYFWARDSRGVLVLVERGSGSENYQLLLVPLRLTAAAPAARAAGAAAPVAITPGAAINLTPFNGTKVQGVWLSPSRPREVLFGLNRRARTSFDVYRAGAAGAAARAPTLDTVNPGDVTSWVVGPDALTVEGAMVSRPDGSRLLRVRDASTADGCRPSAVRGAAAAGAGAGRAAAAAAAGAGAGAGAAAAVAGQAGATRVKGGVKNQGRRVNESAAAAYDHRGGRAPAQRAARLLLQQPGAITRNGSGPADCAYSSARAAGAAAADAYAGEGGAQGSGGGGGGDHGGSGSARCGSAAALAAAIAASASRSNVSCWRVLYEWPLGEEGRVWGLSHGGGGVYLSTSRGRDTTELQLLSRTSGALQRRIASHPLADVSEVVLDAGTRVPAAVGFEYHTPEWRWQDPQDAAEWARLAGWRPAGAASVPAAATVAVPLSRSLDKQTWVVAYSRGDGNAAFYLHRRGAASQPQLLFLEQPAFSNYTMALTHNVVITARDGLRLPAYLTLPPLPGVPQQLPPGVSGVGSEAAAALSAPGGARAADKGGAAGASTRQQQAAQQQLALRLPMVLLVHGGPWKRASWGSSAGVAQWAANRGYAVLNANFRASSGFGKRFSNAGNGQWGVGAMQHDLSDAVAWAVAKGIADPQRVCIMGTSYGGYATFAGLAFTPQLYACGVSFSGMSNLASFVAAMPPWWAPLRQRWLARVGDVTADDALNRRLSPVFGAASVTAPLLIGQGGNDPRVVRAEADGMHAALKASRGSKVQYVLYPDEGHGLSRVANRVDFYGRAERLFAAVLGGRSTAASTAGGGGGLDAWLARSAAPAPKSTAKVVP